MTELDGVTTVQADVPAQTIHVEEMPKPRPVQVQQSQTHDPSVPATTTFQQDLTTAGQRQINLIWERTQAVIAVSVVAISLIAAVVAMIYGKEVSAFLSFICGNIIGFYFSRTNHAAIGGVGPKAQQSYYEGR